MVEEVLTKRIDTQLYLKESLTLPQELRVLNTLQDVKVSHNSVLLVEEKDDEEIVGEEAALDSRTQVDRNIEHIDATDNMRTVITNISGFSEIQRYQVNTDWTITELAIFLVA